MYGSERSADGGATTGSVREREHMIQKHTLLLLAVAACLALAGCTSAIPEDGQDLGEQIPDDGMSGNGTAADGEWCNPDDSMRWANPETGELVSLTIQGTETYEGREVCVGSVEAEDPNSEVARTEYMFTENQEYTRIVMYDAEGEVVNEFETGGGAAGAESWCPTGQTIQTSSPQTGERVTFEYEGIVTYEGREVCKAVYETENTGDEVALTEYYFNENGSYAKYVSYDEEGNVVDEVEASSSGPNESAPSWCPTGESFQFSQQSGESVALEYEGIVTQDGRELCKAVFTEVPSSLQERTDEQVVRAEYFINEDETYVRIVAYDANGNVVDERVQDDT